MLVNLENTKTAKWGKKNNPIFLLIFLKVQKNNCEVWQHLWEWTFYVQTTSPHFYALKPNVAIKWEPQS